MRSLFRLALLATLGVGAAMMFWSFPIISDAAGGRIAPELRLFGGSADEARAFFAALGDVGRAQYLGPQAMLDMAYPALLSLTLILAILRYGARLPVLVRALLCLLPLAAAAVDDLENRATAQILALPAADIPSGMLEQTLLMTQAKVAAYIGALVVVVVLGITFMVGRRRRMRRRAAKQARE